MAIDDRKQRIMMAIVSLYASDGEPVGSNLLSRYFDMAVSSATLRNEMAALTKLGLLEQPHTSAGRVPTAKGYRYYVDNLLTTPDVLPEKDRKEIEALFHGVDYDPIQMVRDGARALSDYLGHGVVATTPRAEDMSVAHFEVIQVGRRTAAVLAVSGAGGVSTRVAKVDHDLAEGDTATVAGALNKKLRFVAEADVEPETIRSLVDSLGEAGHRYWPILSAALTLLGEAGRPHIFFEGQQHLLKWPELAENLHTLLSLFGDAEEVQELLRPRQHRTTIQFGDELAGYSVPGLCLITRQYLAGGGLAGAIAIVGPTRMRYREVVPKLEYFSELLGKSISGAA